VDLRGNSWCESHGTRGGIGVSDWRKGLRTDQRIERKGKGKKAWGGYLQGLGLGVWLDTGLGLGLGLGLLLGGGVPGGWMGFENWHVVKVSQWMDLNDE